MSIRKQVIERFDQYEDDMLEAYYNFLEVSPGITYNEYINNYYADMPELIVSTNNIYSNMIEYIEDIIVINIVLAYYKRLAKTSKEFLLSAVENDKKKYLEDTLNYSKSMISLYKTDEKKFLESSNILINENKILKKLVKETKEISDIAIGSVQTQIINEMKKGPARLVSSKNKYDDKDKFLKNIVDDINSTIIRDGFNNIQNVKGHNLQAGNVLGSNIDSSIHWTKLIADGGVRDILKTNYIQVSYHDFACPLCIPFEKKILIDDVFQEYDGGDRGYTKLSEAISQGLLHKHCKHSLYSILSPHTITEKDVEIDYNVDQDKVNRYNALRRRNYHRQKFKFYNRKYILSQDENTRLEASKKRDMYYNNYKTIEKEYDI